LIGFVGLFARATQGERHHGAGLPAHTGTRQGAQLRGG